MWSLARTMRALREAGYSESVGRTVVEYVCSGIPRAPETTPPREIVRRRPQRLCSSWSAAQLWKARPWPPDGPPALPRRRRHRTVRPRAGTSISRSGRYDHAERIQTNQRGPKGRRKALDPDQFAPRRVLELDGRSRDAQRGPANGAPSPPCVHRSQSDSVLRRPVITHHQDQIPKPSPTQRISAIRQQTMSNDDNDKKDKIVYLFGAGASQAWVSYRNCPYGILMQDLNDPMDRAIRDFVTSRDDADRVLLDDLRNDLIDRNTDYEHIMTFLDESPSAIHRSFSAELRQQFETVLRNRFAEIETELANEPSALYAMLLDMYNVKGCSEELHAILTINYDNYIEAAAAATGHSIDFGIDAHDHAPASDQKKLKLVKLHGSFYWNDTWPITYQNNASMTPLWIPPGIEKAKKRYPFNLLWGMARELLQCDILRIVGCKLSGNDWDLISLLFTTRHSRGEASPDPYRVEVIDSPARTEKLRESYPYLDVCSGFEDELLSELEQAASGEPNWFLIWLQQKAGALEQHVTSIDTPTGTFREVWEEM